ncbi:MAG: ABC transporter ATP-binding protein [Rhodobacteraceae bacterium]|nr:ABC transporter ATP-binding protein [Paracoccaceae bacterium]
MSLWQLLALARPWAGRLVFSALLMLFETLAILAVPGFAGLLVARLAGNGQGAGGVIGVLLALFCAIVLLRAAAQWVSGNVAAAMLAQLRQKAHRHLINLPLSFHENRSQGDLIALCTYEIDGLSSFLSDTLVRLGPLLLTATGAVFLMYRIDPMLAVGLPLLLPLFYVALKLIGRHMRGLAQEEQEAEALSVALAAQDLAILPAIKSFTREAAAFAGYGAAVGRAQALEVRQLRLTLAINAGAQIVAVCTAFGLVMLSRERLQDGAMEVAELFALLLYAALLTRPVAALAGTYGQFQLMRGTLRRLGQVLGTPTEPEGGTALERAQGAVSFENVHFHYPDRGPVLNGVNLHIEAGETLALVAPNGAGKTTMMALLVRFVSPDQGRVLLDGTDIAGLGLKALRAQIGVVPQRALLFNGTIAENIGFGADKPDKAQIISAAKTAQAHDFITSMPNGYETVIGDFGVLLSGGQGQRLALARALIKDPAVLVLDEATSMFDAQSEAAFVSAARLAFVGRTVIIISHRPAILALAGRVVHLSGGKIAAQR